MSCSRSVRTLIIFGAVVGAVSWTRPARACDCARPGIEVQPGAGDVAPVNAHVRIAFPPGTVPQGGLAGVTLTLETSPGGSVVTTTTRTLGAGDVQIVELVPHGALATKQRYQVVMAEKTGNPAVIGEFMTGDAADATPPTWDGIAGVATATAKVAPTTCGSGDAYALLKLGKVADERTTTTALRFAIWLPDASGKLDYDAPPATYVRAVSDGVRLGHWSRCAPANLALPTSATKLGVRVVDLAGNYGAPSEVTLAPAQSEQPASK